MRKDLDEVKSVVLWQDALRTVTLTRPAELAAFVATIPELATAPLPGKLSWQIFDHCASITRIYALYEKAVCDLASEFLIYAPKVTPKYADLHERLRIQHRTGVGQILTKWTASHTLYGSIKEEDISAGLADGTRGKDYQLLCDAFLVDPENFRSGAILRLLSTLGFDDGLSPIVNHESVVSFCAAKLATDTPVNFLDTFVEIRNEIAHGAEITTISSASKIVVYADFLAIFIEAMAALLRSYLIKNGLASAASVRIGRVIHKFTHNIFGIEAEGVFKISKGDIIYAGKKTVEQATVVGLRVVNDSFEALNTTAGFQFGLNLDRGLPDGSILYRWSPRP